MTDYDKIQQILRAGGSFILHANDMQRLKESIKAGVKPGTNPTIYSGVKVFQDKIGFIEEGKPVVAVIGGSSASFSFRDSLHCAEWPLSD